MQDVAAVVLAGGESRRMGEPKALLRIGDVTLLERVVDRLRVVCAPVVVVAQPSLALPPLDASVRVARDPEPDAGPLVGLAAAFDALGDDAPFSFVCAVDVPFVAPAVVARLVALAGDDDAVVARFGDDAYPLTALYARRAFDVARELVRSGERRARRLAEACRTRWVARSELLEDPDVTRDDPHLETFFNVNTRADWERALALIARADGRHAEGG